jgi:hypothetical protein
MGKQEKRKLLDDITLYCQTTGYVRDSIWTFSNTPSANYSSMTRDNFLGFGILWYGKYRKLKEKSQREYFLTKMPCFFYVEETNAAILIVNETGAALAGQNFK